MKINPYILMPIAFIQIVFGILISLATTYTQSQLFGTIATGIIITGMIPVASYLIIAFHLVRPSIVSLFAAIVACSVLLVTYFSMGFIYVIYHNPLAWESFLFLTSWILLLLGTILIRFSQKHVDEEHYATNKDELQYTVGLKERLMKQLLSATVALIIGLGIGWFAGYTYPVVKANHEFRNKTGLSEEDVHLILNKCKEINETVIDSDEKVALNSLAALMRLSFGDQDRAKTVLCRPIQRFYTKYGPANDTTKKQTPSQHDLLVKIEYFTSHNEAFRRAMSLTNEDKISPTSDLLNTEH